MDRIDDYRDNWWCALKGDLNLPNFLKPYYLRHEASEGKAVPVESASLAFVSNSEKKTARDEWKRLSSIGTGPNYLGSQVIA